MGCIPEKDKQARSPAGICKSRRAFRDSSKGHRDSEAEPPVDRGGQYIPYPATWLNQRRWEDEVTAEAAEDRPEPTPIYDLSKLVEYPPGSGLYRPPEEVPHDS